MVTLRNLYLALKDQGPAKRFYRNFFVTRNAWGLFSKRSHYREDGTAKVEYGSKETATKVAKKLSEKKQVYFSNYKCLYCDGYHLGRNRDNKLPGSYKPQNYSQPNINDKRTETN